ncbi:hypothetical protein QBC32DRAFT_72341 [Pseudoneurospora amorphoporcata]|uniref:Uncharacterized protein n=1 Tax=Pseudoneurospora amorphoporcata TaxID=241081 RepID=A0AAN6SC96_9PEZI|nr:hypothetical protein QBC32DRAFT_72341 [Pseudoneurospora amorphoporcata]
MMALLRSNSSPNLVGVSAFEKKKNNNDTTTTTPTLKSISTTTTTTQLATTTTTKPTAPTTTIPTTTTTANNTQTRLAANNKTTAHLATTTKSATTTTTTTTTTLRAHILPILTSTLKTLHRTHTLLFSLFSSTALLLLVRGLSALQLLGSTSLLFSKLVLYRTLLFLRAAAMETASMTWSIFWDSRKARHIRKKLEFEFFVWFLGPGGTLLCFVFWPGWIVLGVMIWGLSCLMTGVQAAMLQPQAAVGSVSG